MVNKDTILKQIDDRQFRVGVIGLGYVGLPLACAAAAAGFNVLGFDVDPTKPAAIAAGQSYLKHFPAELIAKHSATGLLQATTDFERLDEPDALIVCVPTPLTAHREPDLIYVEQTTEAIAKRLRRGQLIVLESTTWPGTTLEVMKPILEATGLNSGDEFYLAFSPEREDPGNTEFTTTRIPKVVGGDGADALAVANALYQAVVSHTVPVSTTSVAEAVKLTENIFRAVNIALVNELKIIYDRMGIDVWEVIDAAKTKPFGFMPFYPGPGLGGHCIPIDPFYLTWKAREFEVSTRFIELAGEINTHMPYFVVERLACALDERQGRGLRRSRVLVLGLAYKKNIDDVRESPAFKVMEILEKRGAEVSFYDPFVHSIPLMREHKDFAGRQSVKWSAETLRGFDGVVIVTDHDTVDYEELVRESAVVVDTRNACGRRGIESGKVVKS